MKMIRYVFAVLFIVITSFVEICACSCSNAPETFTANIRANQIIFRGTILEQIEIPNASNSMLIYHGLTKIKVVQWYQNRMQSDTIYYANGQGAMCTNSLEKVMVGEQVVIKAVKENIHDPSLEVYSDRDDTLIQFMKNFENKPTVGYGICDVSVLKVVNQMVIGNITKNHRRRKWRQINFIRRISTKWADRLVAKLRKRKVKYQAWNLNKFAKMMRKKSLA